jgi:hypothetical protein
MELLKRYRDIYEIDADANQARHDNSVVNFPAPQAPRQSDDTVNLTAGGRIEAARRVSGIMPPLALP